jgi:hypothetical protein
VTKTIEQVVNEAADAAKGAAEVAAAKAASNVAEAAASSGSTQASVGAAYRSSGADVTSDIGQAEWYIGAQARQARNAEDYDQAIRALNLQALTNAQGLANRQNQGGEATTQRINSIQENSLMFDNDWLIAVGLRNPVFLDAIAARVVEAMGEKAK